MLATLHPHPIAAQSASPARPGVGARPLARRAAGETGLRAGGMF